MTEAVRAVEGGVEIALWVVPGARRTELAGLRGDAVRIRVAQPPERDRANRAVLRLLAERLGAEAELIGGGRSRRKLVRISGLSAAAVRTALGIADR